MIDGSAIKEIAELVNRGADPETKEIHGVPYSVRQPKPVLPPAPDPVVVRTLTGFAELVKSEFTDWGGCAHVESEHSVKLLSILQPTLEVRHAYVHADFSRFAHGYAFPFEQFMDTESFIVQLLSRFEETEDRAAVLKVVGNVRDEAVKTLEDDGISQTVTGRVGVALAKDLKVPNPVNLRPFRTFHEVEQPESKFIFRMRGGGSESLPGCALFEADGGAWKNEAMTRIQDWLRRNIEGLTVVA